MADKPRAALEMERFGVFVAFAVALGVAAGGSLLTMASGTMIGLVGYGLATGFALLWGQRTRPKNNLAWWLMALVLGGVLVAVLLDPFGTGELFVLHLPVSFAVALASRHDLGPVPTLMIGASAAIAARPSNWAFHNDITDGDATWIALAVLLAIAAATWEHERLMRQRGAGTPGAWTTIRLGFVTVWTIAILALREDIQWGRAFTWLGADLRGQSGQMLLIGILAAALVLAAFAFQPRQKKTDR